MPTPGQPSGTQNFGLSNGMLLLEAFERCGIDDPEIVRNKIRTAQISLNLELIRFCSPARGASLFNILYGQTITLVPGQAVYTIPASTLAITEMWYTTINGNGAGYNNDRIMVPITRTQYAMLPNKLQPGLPTQFWYERIPVPQVTIWQPPAQGAPNYQITYNALQRADDAGVTGGETPDVPYRALDALAARLAYRIAPKVLPRSEWGAVLPMLKQQADDAWADFATEDQEDGPMIMQPNVAAFARLR